MKIVIFTHDSNSHIIGINSFIKALSKVHEVHVFIYDRYRELLNCTDITVHNYDERIEAETKELYKKYSNKIGGIGLVRKLERYSDFVEEAIEPYKYLLKGSEIYVKYLFDEVKKLNPDLIIRDSCSLFGRIIADKLGVVVYGYNTAGTMSDLYLENGLRENLEDVFNWNLKHFTDSEVNQLFNSIRDKFDEISHQFNVRTFPINYFMNPGEEKNICFSMPWYNYNDDRYVNVQPDIFNYKEDIIMNKEDKIFISTGTQIVFTAAIYNYLINAFKNDKYFVTVSFKYFESDFIKLHNIPKNIKFKKFSNQREELKKSKFFINHGGYNSILESIYYEVPLLLIPLSSDQFFNSRMIEKNKLGIRLSKNEVTTEKVKESVRELNENNDYINSVKLMKEKILRLPTIEEYILYNI